MRKRKVHTHMRIQRREYGLTQLEVAQALGVTDSYYGMLESGERPLSPWMLNTLSETLLISKEYLQEGTVRGRARRARKEVEWIEFNGVPRRKFSIRPDFRPKLPVFLRSSNE